MEFDSIRTKSRSHSQKSNENMIPKKKVKPILSIENNSLNDRQILSHMFFELQKINKPDSNILSSLIRLYKHIKNIQDVQILDSFCKKFPYPFFVNLIVNGENISIRNASIAIFSFCSCSKYFPREEYQNEEFVNFLLSLFTSFDEKNYVHIFRIVKNLIRNNHIIRDYVLHMGILNFFQSSGIDGFEIPKIAMIDNKNNQSHSVLFHKDSIEFLAMCLSYEPNIAPEFAIQINHYFKLVMDLFILFPQKYFSLIESLLMILPQRHKNECSLVFDPDILSVEFVNFILNDLFKLGIEQSFIPIIQNVELLDIPEQQKASMVLTILGQSQKESVLTICLKQLYDHCQEWRVFPEIEQFLISLLENRNEVKKLSFTIQKGIIQVGMLYIVINPTMNLHCLNFIGEFIEDQEISCTALQFIFQTMKLITQTGDSTQKEVLNRIVSNFIDVIELVSSGDVTVANQNLAEDTAIAILAIVQNEHV